MTIDTRGEIDATLEPIELQCNWAAMELSVGDLLAIIFGLAIVTTLIIALLKYQNII